MSKAKTKAVSTRIAIVNLNLCQPSRCQKECMKKCPVNAQDIECITVDLKAKIVEDACTGCGLCIKACPFSAISIINTPAELDKDTIHRYHENGFKLFRLPQPRLGSIYGLVGANGCGKSTSVSILGYKLVPNFGDYKSKTELDNKALSKKFRGTFLQNYFLNKRPVVMKPQTIEAFAKMTKYKTRLVSDIIKEFNQRPEEELQQIIKFTDLEKLMDRQIGVLSGGELQRLVCCIACMKKADVYIYDEPTNYLDIQQRINIANMIKQFSNELNYTIVIEHDLSILDYLSDYVSVMYGVAGAYGITTMPYSTNEGINILLDGYIPTENMRFRTESFNFRNLKKEMDEFDEELKKSNETSNDKSNKKVDKAIKNFVNHNQKSVFVVEHDIMMSIWLAHSLFGRVIVFDGEPSVKCKASEPMILKDGMNLFLKQLGVTFRQDAKKWST